MLENYPKRTDGQERQDFPTIVHALVDAARIAPERVAVICDGAELTYQDYLAGAKQIANQLKGLGIGKGDCVAIVAANCLTLPLAVFGIMLSGAHLAMMNPHYRQRELDPLCAIAQPKAIFCDENSQESLKAYGDASGCRLLDLNEDRNGFDEAAADPGQLPAPEDLGVILFTGGTTGISKGVPHSHASILAAILSIEDRWPTDLDTEVHLNVPPMFHIVGLYHGCLLPVYGRSASVLTLRFNPAEAIKFIEEHKVTVCVAGAPTAYTAMLNHPEFDQTDFSSLKFACGGGGPLADETLKSWENRTGVPALEGYGMTEGAPTCNNPYVGERRVFSVGKPVAGIDLEIVDVETGKILMPAGEPGEIRVRGAHIADGYHNNDEATNEAFRDGWLHTGDIAYRDDDGFVFIVDRVKDMAVVSGFNVYPREIDEILMAHPQIKEAATIGIPDDYKGEIIKAFVAVKAGESLTEEDIKTYCSEHLITYKVPAIIEFRDELPKTPVGKIDKKFLKN